MCVCVKCFFFSPQEGKEINKFSNLILCNINSPYYTVREFIILISVALSRIVNKNKKKEANSYTYIIFFFSQRLFNDYFKFI